MNTTTMYRPTNNHQAVNPGRRQNIQSNDFTNSPQLNAFEIEREQTQQRIFSTYITPN